MDEIKCPCYVRGYMEDDDCAKTDCNNCCPLILLEEADLETD